MNYNKYRTLIYDNETYCILNDTEKAGRGRPTLKEELEYRTEMFIEETIKDRGMGGAMEFIKAPDHFWNYWLGRLGYI